MSHDDLFLEPIKTNLIKGSLDAIDHYGEVLTPFNIRLCFGGVGEVDEKQSLIGKVLVPLKGLPNLVVVGPTLHEDDKLLAALTALEVVLQSTWRHKIY